MRKDDTYDHLGTPVLLLLVAFVAVVARVTLRSDSTDISDLDVGYLGSNSDGFTDEFVSDNPVKREQKKVVSGRSPGEDDDERRNTH